jgi:diguanylate cyclase (GGDEF)-like protein
MAIYMIFSYKFIKQKMRLECEIKYTKEYKKAMNNNGAFAQLDKDFNIIYRNKDFIKIFKGFGLFNNTDNFIGSLQATALNNEIFNILPTKIDTDGFYHSLIKLQNKSETIFIDLFINKVIDKNLSPKEYIVICKDVTEYVLNENELKNQLFIDKVTKLPTRLKLLSDLEKLQQSNTTTCTLLYVQIDLYDEINEFFGSKIGNAIIKKVARWLSINLPNADAKLYKFEHNNFGILCTNKIELQTHLKEIISGISKMAFTYNDSTFDISLSIGVDSNNNEVLKHAYIALQDAKKENKPYKIYNPKSTNESKFLHNIQTNKIIKEALNEDRIVPFFQPILNLKTDEVEKFESLIRIQNRDKTYKKPIEFLEVAKKSKLYPELTKAIILNSFKQLEILGYPITINISVDDILNSKVSSFIFRKLKTLDSGFMITFEILESEQIQNYKKVSTFIKRVRQYGCLVAIDDFGSGYSNFEQLLKLDIDYIKIDGSLIKDITTNRENEIVTKTIVSFAKELGIKTIAEFVSTEDTFNKVKSLGIDYAQGYYIGKPAPLKNYT